MRRLTTVSMGLLFGLAILPALPAQENEAEGPRKIVSKVAPAYPELARRMNLEGTVKLDVTVAPNGTPKSIQAVGGSPVLVKAAEDSVYRFRWAPAKQESKERIEIKFQP